MATSFTRGGYAFYSLYSSLRLHFTSESYDAVKYRFKTSVKPASYEKRHDVYFFEKLSRSLKNEGEMIDFLVSNMIEDVFFIRDMSVENVQKRSGRMQSFSYRFQSQINLLASRQPSFDLCCLPSANDRNIMLDMVMSGELDLETVIIIDHFVKFLRPLSGKLDDPLQINKSVLTKLVKYAPFVVADKEQLPFEKLRECLIKAFTS